MINKNDSVSRAPKALALVLIVLCAISAIVVLYFIYGGKCGTTQAPSNNFGNEMLNGTYTPDAYAITTDGNSVGGGIQPLANPPTVVFSDDFEGVMQWTATNVNLASTAQAYWGTHSACFTPVSGQASAVHTFSSPIAVGGDESVETYFYIQASTSWSGASSGEYFAAKITFSDGKSLLYVVVGTCTSHDSNTAVISITPQVTALGMWVGINIQRIDNDYTVQFGGTLPIPTISAMSFVDASTHGYVVYLDEVQLATLPKALSGGHFWKLLPANTPVTSYFVSVNYKVLISGDIDPANVYTEFKIWVEIHDGTNTASILLAKTLIQDQVLPPITPGDVHSWNSKAFALPADGSVFGNDLSYAFYIQIDAWGELKSSPGTFLHAAADNSGQAFDHLHFQYVNSDGSINVVITSFYVLGSLGSAATLLGVARARHKQKDSFQELNEKEKWFN